MAQFSDTTDDTGLVQECDFILGTDSTDYPLKDKARSANRWYSRTVSLILQADNSF
jgi:hypothetical protein